MPTVGASGAIAGVIGAYILMFPQSRVNVLLGRQIVAMPAVVVLGMWIVFQLISGVGTIAYTERPPMPEASPISPISAASPPGFLMAFFLRMHPHRTARRDPQSRNAGTTKSVRVCSLT